MSVDLGVVEAGADDDVDELGLGAPTPRSEGPADSMVSGLVTFVVGDDAGPWLDPGVDEGGLT
ncbi:MAG TPA: hypothetical protein VK070_08290 [Acidimicrobiia bacterium]|nr:hypothetical protein [Acidimicrobiia bacterium]